jgi:hypothetical protein
MGFNTHACPKIDLQIAMMQQNYKFPKRKLGAGKEESYF